MPKRSQMLTRAYRKNNSGFSLVEVMIACLFLGIALIALVGSVMWDVINVKLQDGKDRAIHLANLILEEMKTYSLDEIIDTDWNKWLITHNYANLLPGATVTVSFPLIYQQEKNGNAYQWGYTYRWGHMYPGMTPKLLKGLLEVRLRVTWLYKEHPVDYEVSTIFSELKRKT